MEFNWTKIDERQGKKVVPVYEVRNDLYVFTAYSKSDAEWLVGRLNELESIEADALAGTL